jgi:hypothetical protein
VLIQALHLDAPYHCCPNYQANCWPKQRMAPPVKRLSP